jgi:hypothetical protein
MAKPQPDTFGVNSRGSAGFHQRVFVRATVGRLQSYGMPRNVPVRFMRGSVARSVCFG